MSKHILPHELAEIVTALLMKPELLGELDSPLQHQSFMRDIGQVVADHCGGQVNDVSEPDAAGQYLADADNSPSLSVSPNDSLPSLNQNVWAYYDQAGWEGQTGVDDVEDKGEPLSNATVSDVRGSIQALLSNSALAQGHRQSLTSKMVDWRVTEDSDLEAEGDDRPYSLCASIGNQSCLEIMDEHGDPRVGIMVEINQGVPAFHIDIDGGDTLLHMHVAQGGLVITPEDSRARFESAAVDRFTYQENGSLLLR
jgi:hypothetical protein